MSWKIESHRYLDKKKISHQMWLVTFLNDRKKNTSAVNASLFSTYNILRLKELFCHLNVVWQDHSPNFKVDWSHFIYCCCRYNLATFLFSILLYLWSSVQPISSTQIGVCFFFLFIVDYRLHNIRISILKVHNGIMYLFVFFIFIVLGFIYFLWESMLFRISRIRTH